MRDGRLFDQKTLGRLVTKGYRKSNAIDHRCRFHFRRSAKIAEGESYRLTTNSKTSIVGILSFIDVASVLSSKISIHPEESGRIPLGVAVDFSRESVV